MMFQRRNGRCEASDQKFKELADYNTRVSKGIVHTPEYDARMAELQAEFDEWIQGRYGYR
jgi:hypothetical protein